MQIDKNALRNYHKRLRNNMQPSDKKNLDLEIASRFLMTNEYLDADTILIYVSTDIEIDTINIINAALTNNKKVAVPKCLNDKEMKFFYISSLSDLKLGKYDILEPIDGLKECIEYENSICITPCFAIDFSGYRIGQGAGYYDIFFKEKYIGKRIALSYTKSVLKTINPDDYDIPVDLIVTDSYVRYIRIGE